MTRTIAIACALTACTSIDADTTAQPLEGGTHSSLYVHGRHTDGVPDGWDYWGGAPPPGINPVAVNYDGAACIATENPVIVAALDDHCRGDDACYVACHSLGCAHVGYALARHGVLEGSRRWNVLWVEAAGSAAGGSELADEGSWTQGDCASGDLRTTMVRHLYDHNRTAGTTFYMFAGANGAAWSGLLAGQDDGVIAYHSAGGARHPASFCNPGDSACDGVLPLGTHSSLYAYHEVYLRDDAESFNHGVGRSGITAPMFDDMASYAR